MACSLLIWFFFFLFLVCSVLFYNISWCRQRLYGCWASLLIGFTSLFEGGFSRVFAASCLFLFPTEMKVRSSSIMLQYHSFLPASASVHTTEIIWWLREGRVCNRNTFPVPQRRELEQGSAQCWLRSVQIPSMTNTGTFFYTTVTKQILSARWRIWEYLSGCDPLWIKTLHYLCLLCFLEMRCDFLEDLCLWFTKIWVLV